jgi:surfactin synthase thioesterase subunit
MTETTLDKAWVRGFPLQVGRGVPLVCFPHAGGSASYFRPLSVALGSHPRLLALQYPGRQDRQHDRLLSSIDELADEAYTALEPVMGGPVAFFGHSMGALVAYEVAFRMKERRGAAPATLFVSGRRAPSRYRDERVHLGGDAALIDELKRLSGTDLRVLQDEEMLRRVLSAMRSDYRAIETYRHRPGLRLDCPVVVLTGDSDPKVEIDEAKAWSEHTTGESEVCTFPGGHFYLADQWRAVAEVISRRFPDQDMDGRS